MVAAGSLMGAEVIADGEPMGAWKLRALVYGLLAIVAMLVVVGRPSASEDDGSPRVESLDRLEGFTVQHQWVRVTLVGRRVVSLASSGVLIRCGHHRAYYH